MTETTSIRLRDVPDAHLRAIGLVALQWSALETTIFRVISICSTADVNESRAILTHMNFPQKADALATMVGLVSPNSDDHKTIIKFVEKLKKDLSPKRNGIVHQDLWPTEADADLISGYAYKARGTLIETRVNLREADILKIADEIGEYTYELIRLWQRLMPAIREHYRRQAARFASRDKSETPD